MILGRLVVLYSSTLFKLQDVVDMTHTSTAKPAYFVFMAIHITTLDMNFGSIQMLPEFPLIEAGRLLACA